MEEEGGWKERQEGGTNEEEEAREKERESEIGRQSGLRQSRRSLETGGAEERGELPWRGAEVEATVECE